MKAGARATGRCRFSTRFRSGSTAKATWIFSDVSSRRALCGSLGSACWSAGLCQRSAADGYWDYEKEGPGEFAPAIVPRDDGGPAPATVSENFPGLALLGAAIRKLPADVPVVLFVPPVYHTMLPAAGSLAAAEEAACKSALKKLVAGGRARTSSISASTMR
jgi:hypothetical protein